jgi:hypothetical protein
MRRKTKRGIRSGSAHDGSPPEPSLTKESLRRLELAGQFAALSKNSSNNAPPLSLEEIQAEIDAYRMEKAR